MRDTLTRAVICFAHVTNQMGTIEGDFEKGEANDADDALNILGRTIAAIAHGSTGERAQVGFG